MKRILSLLIILLTTVSMAAAKDIKTLVVTTTPQMHCNGCETKIKNSLRFEKGIKDIRTNLDEQTVTIKFDADKIKEERIYAVLEKAGYKARALKEGEKAVKAEAEAAAGCNM